MGALGIDDGEIIGLVRNPPVELKTEKHWVVKVCEKVWKVVVKIFNFLCFWKSSPLKFTANEEQDFYEKEIMHGRGLRNRVRPAESPALERRLIQELRPPVAVPVLPNDGAGEQLLMERIEPIESPEARRARREENVLQVEENPVDQSHFEEEYLNRVVEQGVSIAGDLSDIIFEEDVAPILISFQKGAEGIPDLLKMIAGIVLKLGLAANKHYGSLIDKHSISEAINAEFRFLLNWLTTNDFEISSANQIQQYKSELFDHAVAIVSSKDRPELKNYIIPTAEWLIKTDRSVTLKDYLTVRNLFEEDTSKETCNLVVQVLIESKIDQYARFVNRVLQNNLPSIIQNYMKEDVVKMAAKIEIEQVLEIVRNLKWPELIDGTAEIVYDQTNAYLAGARSAKNYRKTKDDDKALQENIALHKKRLTAVSHNPDELRVQNHAKNELARIELEHTHAASDQFFQGYSTHIKGLNFAVHPAVKRVIDSYLDKKDMRIVRAKSEREYFSEKADQILDILLPGDKANIDFWMNKLKIPNEFIEIVEHTKRIAKEVISPPLLALAAQFPLAWRDRILDEAGNIGVLEAKKFLKEILVEKLTEKMDLYTNPDELDELMGDVIIPDILIPQLIQTVAKHNLLLKISDYAPLFHNLFGPNPEESLNELRVRLYQETRVLLPDVDFVAIEMTQAKFNETVEPFLREITERLDHIREALQEEFTPVKVSQLLAKYFEDDDLLEDERPVYGKLITNLVSEMSIAGGWAKWGIKKIEKALSNVLVTSMHDMRTSPELLLKLILEKLPIVFSKAKLDDMIYGPSVAERAQVRHELQQAHYELHLLPSEESPAAVELKSKITKLKIQQERLKVPPRPINRQELRSELSRLEKSLVELEALSIKTEADLARITSLGNQIREHRLTTSRTKMKRNMRVLSTVVYNLMMTKIDYFGRKVMEENTFSFLGSFGAAMGKKIIGGVVGNPDDIYKIITDLYQKLLGDHERNKSLIFSITDLVLSQMTAANREIRDHHSIHAAVQLVHTKSSASIDVVGERSNTPQLLTQSSLPLI